MSQGVAPSSLQGTARPLGLIGGIGMTEVHVYAQHPSPDGHFSGCPHVHAVTDEGYYVLRGAGAVEFHDLEHGYRKLSLEAGQYVHFPPMVMHRLVSDGALVILGIMGNAGLAERGEARIYFGAEVDRDPARFSEMMGWPKREGLAGALKRRDASVAGYMGLMRLWAEDRAGYFAELRRFFEAHCAAMAGKATELLAQVEGGPVAWAAATAGRIAALPAMPGAPAAVYQNRAGSESAFGMCGVLRPMLKLDLVAME